MARQIAPAPDDLVPGPCPSASSLSLRITECSRADLRHDTRELSTRCSAVSTRHGPRSIAGQDGDDGPLQMCLSDQADLAEHHPPQTTLGNVTPIEQGRHPHQSITPVPMYPF